MEKLILVYYLNVYGMSPQSARESLSNIKANIDRNNNDEYHNIILPVKNQETKVECINPRFLPEEDFKKYKDQILGFEVKMKKFLNKQD